MANIDKFGAPYINNYLQQIGFGVIPGHRRIVGLGNNPSVDTSTLPEDITSTGGLYTFMDTAAPLELVSDNAADSAAGTGARTVTVSGLDANYKEVNQVITLNGLTPVAIPVSLLRVNRLVIASAGSNKTNVGTVVCRRVSDALNQRTMPVGFGVSRAAMYTVPAGFTLSVNQYFASINRSGGTARSASMITMHQTPTGMQFSPFEFTVETSSPMFFESLPGTIITEKMDFWLRCQNVSTNGTNITAAWLGVLVDNSYL